MVADALVIRNARLEEASLLARVETLCWPNGLGVTGETFAERVRTYAAGQWVAELCGEVVGVASSQRITQAFLTSAPVTYDALTDRGRFIGSHDPEGEILHLVTVSVSRSAGGLGVGRRLVDRELVVARRLARVRRVIGVTRPKGFSRHAGMSIDEYVAARHDGGYALDPVLNFHLTAGARLLSVHPDYRPDDAQARGYGVMIEYDLPHRAGQPAMD